MDGMNKPLDKALRAALEQAVRDARENSELAARMALEQLGVDKGAPPDFLDTVERELREKLRLHGRQLGDETNDEDGTQAIDCLVEEVAYQHWHRMLFARFLAENHLLIYPGPEAVALTLEECEELAPEHNAKDGWELAARFAAKMLPQIFRPSSPAFKVELPAEQLQKLEAIIAKLPAQAFAASDSLGWLYQYWQAKKKSAVIDSEVKIGARELSAVTQVFTEPYMVSFLLDNTLGSWWAARQSGHDDLPDTATEGELRSRLALPGVPFKYLRFLRQDGGGWTAASGGFADWPDLARDLRILDPCCGSGHFLVSLFLMLVPMRMKQEGISAQEAISLVLSENVFGLELDKRCLELASFALALAAWRYPGAGGYRQLPELNLACTGLSLNINKEEWLEFASENHALESLSCLFDTFQEAPTLGSLLNPVCVGSDSMNNWESIHSCLKQLQRDPASPVISVAEELAHAAAILGRKHHLVLTNVPYLRRSKQSLVLRNFCQANHSDAQQDLSTVFLDRCLSMCAPGGTAGIVLPQNWLFLTSYCNFRKRLLKTCKWNLVCRLGPKSFQTQMWDFNVQLLILSAGDLPDRSGEKAGEPVNGRLGNNTISGIDISLYPTFLQKEAHMPIEPIIQIDQFKQFENHDAVIQFGDTPDTARLAEYASSYQGSGLADIARFRRFFWEIMSFSPDWVLHQSSPSGKTEFSGMRYITLWEDGKGDLIRSPQVTIRGKKAWSKKGVACAWMGNLPVSLYGGCLYDNSAAVIVPENEEHLPAVWSFCSSPDFNLEVRKINQKLQVANATMVKVPFDLSRWQEIARDRYPNGLPAPYSNDPTQWIFHGHPCGSVVWNGETKRTEMGPARSDRTVLQVAVARLLGYRWPAELQELDLAEEQRYWVAKCSEFERTVDGDGIVCLQPARGEAPAADRLQRVLAIAYGDSWSSAVLSDLLKESGHEGKSLESWLRDKFFIQHCQLFENRPFIWQVWDGLRDGFSALVNYHKLDSKLLEKLIYSYLGDWLQRQKRDRENGIEGAQEKLSAAGRLKKLLEQIREGQDPCDIFVRWKTVDKQPVGWEPDLYDGVRINIRPFLMVPALGKKGSGVLKEKPSINWENDRGKDLPDAPWYHLFDGERTNDYHLTLQSKRIE